MAYRINLAADGFSADKTAAALDEIADELENPANLAASTAFTAAYVTFAGVGETVDEAADTIWIGATAFEVTIGTASKSHYNRKPTIEMATSSGIACDIVLPSYWQTMKMMLRFTKSTANSGNVSWATYYHESAVGDTIALPSTSAANIVAAPATGVIQENTGIATVTVNPTKNSTVSLVRSAASDTLTGNIAFLGMRLERLT